MSAVDGRSLALPPDFLRLPGVPFTLEHFRAWAGLLELDNGDRLRLEPYQESFVGDVFEGTPECWLVVPQGNGKTTLVAALALYHARFTPDAWVPVAAASRDQARILYKQAKGFVHRGGAWGFRAFDGYRKITVEQTGSEIEIFASSERTGDGIIPTMCILDELHRHQNLNLYETWRGKLDKRDAQLVTISTAGEPGSEFEVARERIRQEARIVERTETFVRGKHEQVLLHEWAVPEDGDVQDFELVARANPLSSVTEKVLAKRFSSPTMTMGNWRRLTCNLATRSDYAAIHERDWFAAATDDEIPVGVTVWVGLDVGWQWDTTAVVPFWWRDDEYRLLGPARVLLPPRDGTLLDPDKIKRAFVEIHERNPVSTVVMDRSKAEDIANWLEVDLEAKVILHNTGNAHAAADYERFMEALRGGRLHHSGDAGLTRHALNAVTKVLPQGDARFNRPVESRSAGLQDQRVIDALVAAAMVHSEAVWFNENQRSVYRTRGVVTV